jgi:hypothetical protein
MNPIVKFIWAMCDWYYRAFNLKINPNYEQEWSLAKKKRVAFLEGFFGTLGVCILLTIILSAFFSFTKAYLITFFIAELVTLSCLSYILFSNQEKDHPVFTGGIYGCFFSPLVSMWVICLIIFSSSF